MPKKPLNLSDLRYNLKGKNHGENVRHLQCRNAFIEALLEERLVQEIYTHWTEEASLPETPALARDEWRVTANWHLLKLSMAFQKALHQALHRDFPRLPVDWGLPWLAIDLGEAFWAIYVASVTGKELSRTARYRPRTPAVTLQLKATSPENLKRELARLRRDGQIALRQASLPQGYIPHDDTTSKRDTKWLVRHYVGGISKRALAREYSAAGDSDVHSIVQKGIGRALRYLSLHR